MNTTQRKNLTGADMRRHHKALCDAIEVLREVETAGSPRNIIGLLLVAEARAALQVIAESILRAEQRWKISQEEKKGGPDDRRDD